MRWTRFWRHRVTQSPWGGPTQWSEPEFSWQRMSEISAQWNFSFIIPGRIFCPASKLFIHQKPQIQPNRSCCIRQTVTSLYTVNSLYTVTSSVSFIFLLLYMTDLCVWKKNWCFCFYVFWQDNRIQVTSNKHVLCVCVFYVWKYILTNVCVRVCARVCVTARCLWSFLSDWCILNLNQVQTSSSSSSSFSSYFSFSSSSSCVSSVSLFLHWQACTGTCAWLLIIDDYRGAGAQSQKRAVRAPKRISGLNNAIYRWT